MLFDKRVKVFLVFFGRCIERSEKRLQVVEKVCRNAA